MKKRIALLIVGGLVILGGVLSACEPAIPHQIEGRVDCISCHGPNGVKPYPKFHEDRAYENADCTSCHKVAAGAGA